MRRHRWLSPDRRKESIDSYNFEGGCCLRLCKVFALDRTKMFHVKHFGKDGAGQN